MKCPIGCAYCMADLVPSRSKQWNEKGNESIGINKSACFLNRRPGGRPLKDWAPLNLLKGETVGFQGIQDPLDPRWEKDLLWLLNHSSNFGGIILTTKWYEISDVVASEIAKRNNVVLVVSLTGCDTLEPGSSTLQRIEVAKKVKNLGGRVHGLIHPWIPGVSNIDWMPIAQTAGINNFTVKGLRWTNKMGHLKMGNLKMSKRNIKVFKQNEGEEVLIDPPSIKTQSLPRFQGNESCEAATKAVAEIMKIAVVSSSAHSAAVRAAAIKRRIKLQ